MKLIRSIILFFSNQKTLCAIIENQRIQLAIRADESAVHQAAIRELSTMNSPRRMRKLAWETMNWTAKIRKRKQ